MTIHSSNPFATEPDPVRRFRGRLGGAVSLWTTGAGAARAGLTVASVMVANGSPGRLLGLLDPDATLTEELLRTGLGVVQLLEWDDRDLADAFGGVAPAPGGPFVGGTWQETDHGPLLEGRTHALVAVESAVEVGWSLLVTTTTEQVVVVEERRPLEHRRGRYLTP
ncbi:flavin reductase family protein [Nocardioides pocheonensis]|uniref:Flavin reductase n=1 Tax=Nocardioides pocheonensis TaxID=661485 RepID=A0A3N0GPJ1_9ACTN|nr:flavin reductase [Nocardioides pocheonensis]RNM14136.1 flavin reductase [Nocardioides pocheonensis]